MMRYAMAVVSKLEHTLAAHTPGKRDVSNL